jgi:hypothetical protein
MELVDVSGGTVARARVTLSSEQDTGRSPGNPAGGFSPWVCHVARL